MLTAIVGTNWGDEGKGRMVDLLSADYDVVVRYQGGNNAGHTVVNERGKFIMNLMPSGILRPETVNILGPGIVIDLKHLAGEVQKLRDGGIEIEPGHLLISDRATICMPYCRGGVRFWQGERNSIRISDRCSFSRTMKKCSILRMSRIPGDIAG